MGDLQNRWLISWKIPLRWTIWGYLHFRKPPYYVLHEETNDKF